MNDIAAIETDGFSVALHEYMEREGLSAEQVWTVEDIEPLVQADFECEIMEIDGEGVCMVTGRPFEVSESLDYIQGFDNEFGAFGTCTMVSISNLRTMAGHESSESEVVRYAMENDLCEKPAPGVIGGGMKNGQTLKVLEHYGLSSHIEFADTADYERLAELSESGHGVILYVNSGVSQERLWKVSPNEDGLIEANHAITLTGVVRDMDTGAVKGFYVCDSSAARSDGAKLFISVTQMDECYKNVLGGGAAITNEPIRTA